jgi:HK97 gp10 family phage protein
MRIEIEGLDNLSAVLEKYSSEAAKKLGNGIARGCEIVQSEAKALCPVSTEKTRPGGPHGELRASISHQVDGTEGYVGTNTEYAGYVEFGTCKMAAQPYLVPALTGRQSDVIAAIAAAFMG